MKSLFNRSFLLTFLLLAGLCCRAYAQDAGMSDLEAAVVDASDDRTGFVPGEELKYGPRTSGMVMAQDSLSLQMADFPMLRASQKPAEKTSEKSNSKKDDSILTYNFLYYIIQKYKLQDIID